MRRLGSPTSFVPLILLAGALSPAPAQILGQPAAGAPGTPPPPIRNPDRATLTVAPEAEVLRAALEARYGTRIRGDAGALTVANLKAFDAEYSPLFAYRPGLRRLLDEVDLVDPGGRQDLPMGAYDAASRQLELMAHGLGKALVPGTTAHEVGHAIHSADATWHQALRDSLVNVLQVYPSEDSMQNAYEHTAELIRFATGTDGLGTDRTGTALPRASWLLLRQKVPLRADWRRRVLADAVVARSPRMPPLSEDPVRPPGFVPKRWSDDESL